MSWKEACMFGTHRRPRQACVEVAVTSPPPGTLLGSGAFLPGSGSRVGSRKSRTVVNRTTHVLTACIIDSFTYLACRFMTRLPWKG